jgi:hypothetical protein
MRPSQWMHQWFGDFLVGLRGRADASPAAIETERDDDDWLHAGFDNYARSVGSQAERRDVLRVSAAGLFSGLLGPLALQPARAAADCLCGRELYDPAIQCCTPSGVQTKHPIADLARCPSRVPHPGLVCTPNGCGAEGGQSFPGGFGAASFLPCCNGHDCCWGRCNSDRNACDGDFLGCMRASCDAAYPPGSGPMNAIRNSSCRAAANAYHTAVQSGFGTDAYNAAQRAACDCCAEAPCPTCPGGTCSSLPSCQDPGCVCFQTVEGRGFCHRPQLCAGLASCSSSASCPRGWACVSVTCCSGSGAICIQPCFVVSGPSRQSSPSGPSTAPMLH